MRIIFIILLFVIVSACTQKVKNKDNKQASSTIQNEISKRSKNKDININDGLLGSLDGMFGSLMAGYVHDTGFKPIASSLVETNAPDEIVSKIEKILVSKGYVVSRDDIFLILITNPKGIGFHKWRRKHEKWNIKYSVQIQVRRGSDLNLYWKYSFKVVGTRSGEVDREFSALDFENTEIISNDLISNLSNLLSKDA